MDGSEKMSSGSPCSGSKRWRFIAIRTMRCEIRIGGKVYVVEIEQDVCVIGRLSTFPGHLRIEGKNFGLKMKC